jgi:hypothetical protein
VLGRFLGERLAVGLREALFWIRTH